ncbi:MAG: NADH-quinone oxidoreductase subunit C [Anaerolineae bacterium CG_4_9_14_3_um_filter_57_17]|nr:NADH-quinone oxidoreductase subunit C [bacterium]NCT19828.1 NADH-quinone oxidoreductase subunit C [bacterium]OIO84479.1 MAG: NADH-quinone oxidoreductase subunit C [Anaerolineae bacterium CG2_30_57_67]PJB66255.1 MAG: NADH-quinone oxidoreductase subunit C [Anaerolineae bacterium CG_4_9_14_3_um_filter_57_17]
MNEKLQPYLDSLAEKFSAQPQKFAGETSLILPLEKLTAAAQMIHRDFGFELLSFVSAVDYWPQEEPRFHLIYRFTSVSKALAFTVRVPLSGISPVAPTLEKEYRNANWHEREVFDLFGITFTGHSDLRRLLMPADWQGHPLRKDYPLGYEEPQYTFNFDEIAARKPSATRE